MQWIHNTLINLTVVLQVLLKPFHSLELVPYKLYMVSIIQTLIKGRKYCAACSSGCVQRAWLVADSKNQFHLLAECLIAVGHPHVGDVGTSDVISCHTFLMIVLAQPVLLHLGAGQGASKGWGRGH